jgi:hypothetical protein
MRIEVASPRKNEMPTFSLFLKMGLKQSPVKVFLLSFFMILSSELMIFAAA